ncbi:MAG: hypothetical protein IT244_07410 [Bacteroidia bacterium]|nr:hypothetical protein [Bacteroidia bacterium]
MNITFNVKPASKFTIFIAVAAGLLFIESCKKEEVVVRKPPRISMNMYNSAVGQIASRMDNGNTLYAGVNINTGGLKYGIVNVDGIAIYNIFSLPTTVTLYKASTVALGNYYYIMASTYDPASGGNVLLLKKVDATGKEVWEKRYSIPEAGIYNTKIMATKNGELLMLGYSYTTKTSPAIISIEAYRLDKNGLVKWQLSTPAQYYYDVLSCIEKSDGDFLFVSKDQSTNEMVFMDVHESGYILKQTRLAYSGVLGCVTATKDNSGYICAGYINGDIDLIKVSSNYTPIWSKKLGKPDIIETASDILELQDGSYVITGTAEGSLTLSADVLFLKADANGDGKVYRAYGEPGSQFGYQLGLSGDNKIKLYGLAIMNANNSNEYEVFSLTLDENGNY